MLVLLSLFSVSPFLFKLWPLNVNVQLCNALASLQKYGDALEIINRTLRLAHTFLSAEKIEKLGSLGVRKSWTFTILYFLLDWFYASNLWSTNTSRSRRVAVSNTRRCPTFVWHSYDTCRKSQKVSAKSDKCPLKNSFFFVSDTLRINGWHPNDTHKCPTIQTSVSNKYLFFFFASRHFYTYFGQIPHKFKIVNFVFKRCY